MAAKLASPALAELPCSKPLLLSVHLQLVGALLQVRESLGGLLCLKKTLKKLQKVADRVEQPVANLKLKLCFLQDHVCFFWVFKMFKACTQNSKKSNYSSIFKTLEASIVIQRTRKCNTIAKQICCIASLMSSCNSVTEPVTGGSCPGR